MGEDEDPSEASGPCPLPPGRKMYWRSASWSSRSSSAEHGKECADKTESSSNKFRRFPVPLTPHSSHPPKARACLPPLQPLSITRRNLDEWPKAGSDDIGEWPHPPTPGGTSKGLKLDLSSFPQNPDPTGTVVRDRIAFFDKECSKVAEHIYLGGTAVARDREILHKHGITHVLNCVGFVCPEYFKADLVYKTLWLQDSPSEDITSILYDVFDYFEDVREQGGRLFVHCCQGVSRSTSLVIAYLMWREGQSFDDAFQYVKAARGIANPNMGFACQLLQCQKRVHAIPLSPSSVLRMFRMAPHSPYDPLHLVPKMLNDPSPAALDSRGAFIVHVPSAIYVWIGENCEPAMQREAKAATFQVVRYERVQGPIITVEEGKEPPDFWECFWTNPVAIDNSDNSMQVKKDQVDSAVKVGVGRKKVEGYDIDFELFHKAMTGGIVPPFSSSSGAETRIPARESNWSILRRKFVSGGVKERAMAPRAALCRVYSDSKLLVDSKDAYVNKCEVASPPSSLSSDTSINSKTGSDSPPLSSSTASSSAPSPARPISDVSSKPPHPLTSNLEHLSGGFCMLSYPKTSPGHGKGDSFLQCEQRENISSSLNLATVPSVQFHCAGDAETADRVTGSSSGEVSQCKQRSLEESSFIVKKNLRQLHDDKELSKSCSTVYRDANVSKPVLVAYSWPALQKIANFCAKDLQSECVVLILIPGADAGNDSARKLFLWVGSCHVHQDTLTQGDTNQKNDEDLKKSDYKEVDWLHVGQNFLSAVGLPKDILIEVVKETEESENFLELIDSL